MAVNESNYSTFYEIKGVLKLTYIYVEASKFAAIRRNNLQHLLR